jgi:hypothetical protein
MVRSAKFQNPFMSPILDRAEETVKQNNANCLGENVGGKILF